MQNDDPSNAAAQLEQCAQYLFQLGHETDGASLLESAFRVEGIPTEQALYYANTLSSIYEDFGDSAKSQYWEQQAQEKQQLLE